MPPETPRKSHLAQTKSIRNDTIPYTLFLAIFAFRIANALSIKTFFQPDEYFQALEPAWQEAFGKESGAWITWEWHAHLRSSTYPLLISGIFRTIKTLCTVLQVSPPLQAEFLIAAPKIQQAFWASFMDVCTYGLACRVYGKGTGASIAALALTLGSPWQWFCSTRTFSNSLETSLTAVALASWPWGWYVGAEVDANGDVSGQRKGDGDRRRVSANGYSIPRTIYPPLVCAATACILRPTNILIWAILSVSLLWFNVDKTNFINLAQAAAICGSAVLTQSIAMDRIYFGKWVFPPLQFLYFNLVEGLAVFYGTNRIPYYFTEGLGLLLTTALLFAVIGIWDGLFPGRNRTTSDKQARIRYLLALVIVIVLAVHTLLAHKEVRFIYPLLPMLHVLAAKHVAHFFDPFPIPRKRARLAILVLVVILNVIIAFYTTFVHQRGVIDAMHYLRHEQEARMQLSSVEARNLTVGFFMPCHSTPWRSHLVHPSIHGWALTCEPPIGLSKAEQESYLDEADLFYADPVLWIERIMQSRETIAKGTRVSGRGEDGRRDWPEYLVFFQQLESTMKEVLERSRYRECWRGFNTHWHDDWRREGDVVVWWEDKT